jgi:hypothetical protein
MAIIVISVLPGVIAYWNEKRATSKNKEKNIK